MDLPNEILEHLNRHGKLPPVTEMFRAWVTLKKVQEAGSVGHNYLCPEYDQNPWTNRCKCGYKYVWYPPNST